MEEYRSELEAEVASAIADELSAQTRQTFDKIVETDWRLTQHNFLVNAGGAAAVLAYWGTNTAHNFALYPLLFFVVGVIASGIEIRTLRVVYSNLHNDALRRRKGFMTNKLKVKESVPPPDVGGIASKIKHWSSIVSQVSFVLGFISAVVAYFVTAL
jgi:hypothetical protein